MTFPIPVTTFALHKLSSFEMLLLDGVVNFG